MWRHRNVFRLLCVKRYFHWIRTWASWRLKPPVSCLIVSQLVQTDTKEIIWALHWLMALREEKTPEAVCPHKVPVMQRTFSYHDVFMWHRPTNWRCFGKMILEILTQLPVFVHFTLIQVSVSVVIMLTSRVHSIKRFYPSALRAGGVLSSRFGRAGGCQTCGTHIFVTAWWIFSIRWNCLGL